MALSEVRTTTNPVTQQQINDVCPGWSSDLHWAFWSVIANDPAVKSICILGAYLGRDMAYVLANNPTVSVVGVDLFEDKPCADWSPADNGKTWGQAGYGSPPDEDWLIGNLTKLGLWSTPRACIAKFDAAEFLDTTKQSFDFIYIDTSHDYESVMRLIHLAVLKAPRVGGDDFLPRGCVEKVQTWGVNRAVRDSFSQFDLVEDYVWVAESRNFVRPDKAWLDKVRSATAAPPLCQPTADRQPPSVEQLLRDDMKTVAVAAPSEIFTPTAPGKRLPGDPCPACLGRGQTSSRTEFCEGGTRTILGSTCGVCRGLGRVKIRFEPFEAEEFEFERRKLEVPHG